MKHFPKLIKTFLCLLVACSAHAIEDKMAASVDDKVITEHDIRQRYEIISKTQSHMNPPPYTAQLRQGILEQLVQDRLVAVIWSQHVAREFDFVSAAEIDSFIEANGLQAVDREAVKEFFDAQHRRQIYAREKFGSKITIPNGELETYLSNEFNWQALPIRLTFKVAYDDKELDTQRAEKLFRRFESLHITQAPSVIFSQGRWELKDTWQFFEDEDEHIALFIEDIQIDGFLDGVYTLERLSFSGDETLTEEHVQKFLQSSELPKGLELLDKNLFDVSHQQQLPPFFDLSKTSSFSIGQIIMFPQMDNHQSCVVVREKKEHERNYITSFVKARAENEIFYQRVEQSFKLWVEQARSEYYINIL